MKKESGMTLIELMISVAIISLALLAAVFIVVEGRQISMDARARLLAANAARSILETVKETPLNSIATIDESDYIPAGLNSASILLTTNPANVTNVTLATVTITVSWLGAKNRSESFSLTTQRSAYS